MGGQQKTNEELQLMHRACNGRGNEITTKENEAKWRCNGKIELKRSCKQCQTNNPTLASINSNCLPNRPRQESQGHQPPTKTKNPRFHSMPLLSSSIQHFLPTSRTFHSEKTLAKIKLIGTQALTARTSHRWKSKRKIISDQNIQHS